MDFSVEHGYSHLRILAGNEEQCPKSGCLYLLLQKQGRPGVNP